MLTLRGPNPIPSPVVQVFLRPESFLRSVLFLQCFQNCIENPTAPAKGMSSWLEFCKVHWWEQLDGAGFMNTETGMKRLPCTSLEPFPDFVSQEKISRKENVFRTWSPDELATRVLEDRGFVLKGAHGSASPSLSCIWGLHVCSVSTTYHTGL